MLGRKKRQICLVCGTYWKTCYCTQKARRALREDLETATAATIHETREVMRNATETTYESPKVQETVPAYRWARTPKELTESYAWWD